MNYIYIYTKLFGNDIHSELYLTNMIAIQPVHLMTFPSSNYITTNYNYNYENKFYLNFSFCNSLILSDTFFKNE